MQAVRLFTTVGEELLHTLLALLLPWNEVEALKDMLVDYAAESGDHTTSDGFVKLLKSRRTVEGQQERKQGARNALS